jgi:hypothetical protein
MNVGLWPIALACSATQRVRSWRRTDLLPTSLNANDPERTSQRLESEPEIAPCLESKNSKHPRDGSVRLARYGTRPFTAQAVAA